jgi:hypothetical protein
VLQLVPVPAAPHDDGEICSVPPHKMRDV